MENQPKNNKPNKYLIIFLCLMLTLVCVLAAAIYIMFIAPEKNTGTEETLQISASTPAPTQTQQGTLAPIVTIPVITVEPTSTPGATATLSIEEDIVWVNLSHLIIRKEPDFDYDKIGNIPYGTKIMGEIDGLWMYTSYGGVSGYVYVGKMKDTGRACVVYSESDLEPLD